MMISSSLQYRLLKKLIGLFVGQEDYDVLQGYQIFGCYYGGDQVKNKYKNEDIKAAVEEVYGITKLKGSDEDLDDEEL